MNWRERHVISILQRLMALLEAAVRLARRAPGALIRRFARIATRYAPNLVFRLRKNAALVRIYRRISRGSSSAFLPALFVRRRVARAAPSDDYRETLTSLLATMRQWHLGRRIDG